LAVGDRIAGRAPLKEEARALAAPTVTRRRFGLRGLRDAVVSLPQGVVPGVPFTTQLPGDVPPPQSKATPFRWSVPAAEWNDDPANLRFATVRDLAAWLRAGRITSVQLTQSCLERLRTIGNDLHCVVTLTEELALRQAAAADADLARGIDRGPLHGIPYGLKDLFATRTYPTTCGISAWKDRLVDEDATVVRRLAEAGAVLVAKLSLGELAMGDVWFGGLTRNPWKPDTGSSGSSAGSAAAVAAGLVPFAIGTETLGSIVSPCCVCGTVGLRPTFGLLSRAGAMPLTPTMDKPGPICRSAEDAAAVLSALAGPDPLDLTTAHSSFSYDPDLDLAALSVGYDADAFDALNRRNAADFAPYAEALEVLKKAGVNPKPITLPRYRLASVLAEVIIGVEGTACLSDLTLGTGLDSLVQQAAGSWPNTFRAAEHVPAADYVRALRLREQLKRQWSESLQGIDAYLAIPRFGPTLVATNLTGHPTLVTRAGAKDGLPVMIEFVGNLHRESAIVSLATAYERATGHIRSWPAAYR
jgi:Asp-tRNA(Asn)/Glu-tRNA(Gln) amidotransferase A subunit family amidase